MGLILAVKCTSKVVTSPNFDIFLCWLKYENDLCLKKIGNVDHGVDFTHMATSCISAYSVKSTPRSTLPIYFYFKSFSYFNRQRKISKGPLCRHPSYSYWTCFLPSPLSRGLIFCMVFGDTHRVQKIPPRRF